jgi:C4-dicarboxylate-specific signal transduction histidine kinase
VVNATRDVIALLQTGMKESIIATSFEGGGEIMCVPEEFNQVLTNLVQNALDALPADGAGRVDVRIWNEEAALLLSVKDNGCGITPEQRNKIFTPFYTTKEVGKGMGLGLSIVWRVVTSIGGTVQVASQPGEGTEFKLRLPALSVPERRASA